MATRGVGYFDGKGHFFRTPEEATMSDLAALLGRTGEGEGLSLGIAKVMLERRAEIEAIFASHDAMTPKSGAKSSNVSPIRQVS